MALMGDLEEAKRMWKNSSLLGRSFIVISTFLAVSSIVSLSDIVFKWKGFIQDGLNFYREYITLPIYEFISSFGFQLELPSLDMVVILLLMLGAIIRKKVIEHDHVNHFLLVAIYVIIGIIVFSGVFAFINFVTKDMSGGGFLSPGSAGLLGLISTMFYYPFLKKFNSKERVAYYTPIIISVLIVFILAAINVGLNRQV